MSEHKHKDRDINQKTVFLISRKAGESIPTIFIGMPTGSWEYMVDGLSHDFDLTKAGLPVKLVIFRGETHDSIMKDIQAMASKSGATILDQRNKDFKIDGVPRKE